MKMMILQLIAIFMLAILVIGLWLRTWKEERAAKSYDKTFWLVQMQRMGKAPKNLSYFLRKKSGIGEELHLPLGVFFAGNRWTDTIYLGVGGERVRLFLNIQKEEIVLTVLEGKIQTKNGVYEANKREQISIHDFTKIVVGDLELQFLRKKVK